MSEPKLISPLLDRFAIGSAISDHNGVRCYPAMREDSDNKYIVKVITIPSSSLQLEALLLSGAYPDAQSARGYFETLVNDVENEAQVLRHLSKLEGFAAYDEYQVVPADDGIGFEVYLLGSYKRSLAKYFRTKPMTHLGAVNLGIDLCAAMSVCRQAGCLYIDLKPENIFITEDGRYQVGDLGFIPMSSLKYAAIPDKYRSSYTAPELDDPLATIHKTVDIYAIGLILYQAYNNNTLPFEGKAPAEVLPPPMYADYEMAEIILKACAPDPDDRWSDPKEMGQALVAYMQRNGANDTPIVPPAIPVVEEAAQAPAVQSSTISPDMDMEGADTDDTEITIIPSLIADETAPTPEDSTGFDDSAVSDELSDILAQAEELLAHELPAPAVAPDPIEIPMPDPIVTAEKPGETGRNNDGSDTEPQNADVAVPQEDPIDSEDDYESASKKGKGVAKRIFGWLLTLILIAGIAFGGYYFYTNYYLQNVEELTVIGKDNTVQILIDSQIDDALLSVTCTDTYGTVSHSPVENGSASFVDLNPGAQYTIQIQISGFHKLTGKTSSAYSTPLETNVLDFTAAIGPEDGAVILSFTVTGQDMDPWTIAYTTDGEEEKTVSFSGHSTTITGLTVGKTYRFRLVADESMYLIGTTEISFVAPKLVFAENLAVTGYDGSSIQVDWTSSDNAPVDSWTVRCYNDNGYDVTVQVTDCSATFDSIDTSTANTIEVTAAGMNQCVRTFITANPITITDISGSNFDPNVLSFQWDYVGTTPADGWLLSYTIDNSLISNVVPCSDSAADIETVIPGGVYHMSIQTLSGSTLFGGTFASTVPEADTFEGYDVSADDMEFSMCRTPDVTDWSRYDLSDEDMTTAFAVGEKASFLVYLTKEYNVSYDDIVTLYVIRDVSGQIVSADTQTRMWIDMWYRGYCELDIPALPETPGDYTVDIYFNGDSVTTQSFTVE